MRARCGLYSLEGISWRRYFSATVLWKRRVRAEIAGRDEFAARNIDPAV